LAGGDSSENQPAWAAPAAPVIAKTKNVILKVRTAIFS
jgi:hypothetical protein